MTAVRSEIECIKCSATSDIAPPASVGTPVRCVVCGAEFIATSDNTQNFDENDQPVSAGREEERS